MLTAILRQTVRAGAPLLWASLGGTGGVWSRADGEAEGLCCRMLIRGSAGAADSPLRSPKAGGSRCSLGVEATGGRTGAQHQHGPHETPLAQACVRLTRLRPTSAPQRFPEHRNAFTDSLPQDSSQTQKEEEENRKKHASCSRTVTISLQLHGHPTEPWLAAQETSLLEHLGSRFQADVKVAS